MQTENTLQRQTLYEIRQDHYNLVQMIEDADGELTPEIEQALQLNEKDFENKAISYAYVCKKFEDRIQAINNEIKRLSALFDKACNRQTMFKKALSTAMQEFNVESIETATLKIFLSKSESVEITNENIIPDEFFKVKEVSTLSKTMIKEAIKVGIDVPGAELIQKKNLQIR